MTSSLSAFTTRSHSRRRMLQFLGGLAGAAALKACSPTDSPSASSESNQDLTKITLGGVPWIGLTPVYIAQEQGFFAEEGVDVELSLFSANGESRAAFVSNQLSALSAVGSEVVLVKAQDKDFKVVLVEDNSVGADGILAKDTITSIEDFKGKEVAVDTTGVSYFFLLQVLEEAGLSKDDITVVNIDSAGAATAFQSGNADIAVSYAPFLQQADEAVEDGRIIYDSAQMPTAITDMYLFDSAYIEENPDAVQGFVNAVFKGLAFLESNPEEGLAIAAAELGIEPDALESDLKGVKLPDVDTNRTMLTDTSSDLYILSSLKELADFLTEQGEIDAVPDGLDDIIDAQFVEAATF